MIKSLGALRALVALSVMLSAAWAVSVHAQDVADEAKDWGVAPMKSPKGAPYNTVTPLQVPGARTVSTVELKQLLAQEPQPVLIDALGSAEMIDSAHGMGQGIGEQRMFGRDRSNFPKALERLTGGDKGRALVFYCRGSMCWHSYNASLHALDAGYTNVMWYRGGIDAWKASGGKTVPYLPMAD